MLRGILCAVAVGLVGSANLLVGCGGDDGGDELPSELHCNAADLEAALLSARSGQSVGVGRCEVEGHFIVPAGVTLIGASQSDSKIAGTSGERALSLETSSQGGATRVKSLTITSDHRGVRAESTSGSVEVEDVTIEITEGAAAAFIGLPMLRLTRVIMTGPVTPENSAFPESFDARAGLTLLDIEDAVLTDVDISHMVDFGAYFDNSTVIWDGGSANENLRVGIRIEGGDVELNNLETCDNFTDVASGVFAHKSDVTSMGGLVAEGNDRGFAQLGGTAHLMECELSRNSYAGAASVDGELTCLERCLLADNLANGVYANRSSGVELLTTTISSTQVLELVGSGDTVGPFAYGAQLLGSTTGLLAKDVIFDGNILAGAVVDMADPDEFDPSSFDNVQVTGAGDANGVILQSYDNDTVRTPDGTWDTNLLRMGTTSLNDLSLSNPLLIDTVTVGITTPDI